MTNDTPQDWKILLQELDKRRNEASAMGGTERLKKRESKGLANARQLIALFTDKDSFLEIGSLAGGVSWNDLPKAPANALVCGFASINQQKILIGVEDFTVQGGSIGPATNAKRMRLATLALQEKTPLLMLLDGAGERASNALQRHAYAANDMQILSELSGKVPSIAVVIGSSAGHGAITALLMDVVIMLDDATLFAAGPPLVYAATGEVVSKEDLGGADIHCKLSGVAHHRVSDANAAKDLTARYLNLLPANAWTYPASTQSPPEKNIDNILSLVPCDDSKPYDMRKVINTVVDDDSYFEHQKDFGCSLLCGFARLNGHAVAIVANQPLVIAGSINADAAEKAARFIHIANAYHIPVIFLADNPGIMSGSQAEQQGTLRAAAKMYAAQTALQSPKLHVTLRKAFGFGSSIMAMNPFDKQSITLAWPGVSLGGMPAAGGAQAANLSENNAKMLAQAQASGAWTCADTLAFDEVIDPRETRAALITALETALNRRTESATPRYSVKISP